MRSALTKLGWPLLAVMLASCSALAKPRDKAADAPLAASLAGATAENGADAKPTPAASGTPAGSAASGSPASGASSSAPAPAPLENPAGAPAAGTHAIPNASAGATAPAPGGGRAPQAVDPELLVAALAELEGAGVLDGEARQRLIDDLRRTDPSLWPTFLQYFKMTMLRRAAERSADGESTRVARGAASRTPDDPDAADEPASAEPRDATVAVASDEPDADAAGPENAKPTRSKSAGAGTNAIVGAATAGASPTLAPSAESTTAAPEGESAPPRRRSSRKGSPSPSGKPADSAVRLASATSADTQSATPASPAAAPPPADESQQTWRDQLEATIAGLEEATREPPQSQTEVAQHATLRMLYLIAGRRDKALEPIEGISPGQQDFWSQEIYGLATYLDTERNPESGRRATEALDRLRSAAAKLGDQAMLAVKNLTFCTEVTSFGVYKPFEKLEFQAGQEVLLYAEIENFRSRRDENGYCTSLRSSYQILDPHGARVEAKDCDVTESRCQNLRRDFFMRYHIWMPKRIYGGRYTLQLTIEDTQSQKIGQSSIEFTIKDQ